MSIRTLRSDNAHEYLSQKFQTCMSNNGTLHQTSCPYTLLQNEVVKCKNRHLVEATWTLLLHVNVPLWFCRYFVLTTCYLINFMPLSVLHNKIPHSILFPHSPFTQFLLESLGLYILYPISSLDLINYWLDH